MGFRFRRSIRLLPGVRLNVGKRGISTSIGVRGAHVTLGRGTVHETVGLPGTGLSYTHVEGRRSDAAIAPVKPRRIWVLLAVLIAVIAVWRVVR